MVITLRHFLHGSAVLAVTIAGVAGLFLESRAATGPSRRPNVLVILADDQGWGDLSINGNTNISTPRIDTLARSGAMFERFYVCPLCSPTRAEFLTGRYHPRGGVTGVSTGAERLNLGETTIAETFKSVGYATAAFGKWHNGTQYPYHPNARGFDEFYGFCSGHWGTYFDPPLEHNGKPVRGKGFITDDLTDHAMEFIERNREQPFFCYVPYNTPHSPMQVPDRFYAKFKDAELGLRARNPAQEDVGHTRAALAMCENIDWNVGRLLDRLDALKLTDQTIVLYFSDNGPNGWRWNGGMKGRKGSTDEGGVRVPLFVRWPGHIPAGKNISQSAAAIDLLPTLAALSGVPITSTKPLDGLNLTPLLTGTGTSWPERLIFSHWSRNTSARWKNYRLDASRHLYDLATDPGQDNDVSGTHPDVQDRLVKAVAQWKADVGPKQSKDVRPFTVGYPDFPITQLPARDGVPHGNIRRSASAPNCSFFENWTNTEDFITWNVAVDTTGDYEAVVYYTCPKQGVGSEIELSLGDDNVRCAISEAHDPPLKGAEHDRVPRRAESYVKDFKPLSIGRIHLKEGRSLLTLRAVKVPAGAVMDVRSVVLTLKQ